MDTSELKPKKIRIDELSVEMFIVNLGRFRSSHPFLRNQLKIRSQKQIQKLRKHEIQEVYIDPGRGMDVPSPEPESADAISPAAQKPEEIPSPLERLEEDKESPIRWEFPPFRRKRENRPPLRRKSRNRLSIGNRIPAGWKRTSPRRISPLPFPRRNRFL
jgi:hypothetical protein